jgi:hypothetical protein
MGFIPESADAQTMDVAHWSVYAVIALIVGVTLASGPLVGAVDLTHERPEEAFSPGSGSANVTVLSLPERATLTKGKYGAGSYYLEVPDATVRIDSLSGQPMVVYTLRIRELGYTRSTTHFLEAGMEGSQPLNIERGTLSPDRIAKNVYAGELLVEVRDDAGERIIETRNVTVEVRG